MFARIRELHVRGRLKYKWIGHPFFSLHSLISDLTLGIATVHHHHLLDHDRHHHPLHLEPRSTNSRPPPPPLRRRRTTLPPWLRSPRDHSRCGDSFSGWIALAVATVDTTLRDSLEVRRKITGLGRKVRRVRMRMKWRIKKETVTPTQAILVQFSHLKDVNVVYATGETQRENSEPVWPRGMAGRP
jgi:hypothetical protein